MTPAATATPGAARRDVAVEGVRFALDRREPARKRRTTPVLLLHGVPQTSAMWGPVADELCRDRIVLAPDLKGLGGSEARGPYDVATLAREMAALVLHEVDGQVDVVGHDWGGVVALALAGVRPELVRRLVVINAPYRKVDMLRLWYAAAFSIPVVPEALFAATNGRVVERMLAAGARLPMDVDRKNRYVAAYDDPRRVKAMLSYYRAATRARLGALVGRHDRLPDAKPQSALVIWGAADPAMPLAIGEAVATNLGTHTELVSLPGVGHFPVDEAPEVVTDLVATFLRADNSAAP
jgi:haloacetate dehalogenase